MGSYPPALREKEPQAQLMIPNAGGGGQPLQTIYRYRGLLSMILFTPGR
jgi:hypothetical protein